MTESAKKILVVDDEEKIRTMICDYLKAVGFITETAVDGVDAVSKVVEVQPDIVLMDVMMPGIDGIDATRRIRERSRVPIIMLTAKAEEGDKIIGLEMGADDYIVKPFSLKELGARIRVLLRRESYYNNKSVAETEVKQIVIKDVKMDLEKMEVYRGTQEIHLTSLQFTILKLLMSSPGRVFTRIQILNSFQEDLFEGYERTIDVHVKNIRKALERKPSEPEYIETVWGTGYKFSDRGEANV
ncbi:MAG: response regulator transcription factor [Spirochaetales bacterium]|nr:response regulator transcription factor [Spirochaetales bacterium]